MTSDFKKQRVENWVSDFCTSDEIGSFPAAVKDVAAQVLLTFLAEASVSRGIEPEDMEEAHLKKSLLGPVAKLNVPEAARGSIASLCGAFLADLETQGRLGGGRLLGAYVRALKEAYVEAASGKIKPVVRPGSRIGRNDPCPCGSGKKYKKCCMRE